MSLVLGDCLEVLRTMPENSVDAIVTDPPYGLKFMNKHWDYDVPSVEIWQEALRVLKPGGHLLSFGGTRTYHRMAVNIEDAGFEIRDQIQWLYGSGFPKSHNLKDEWQGWGTALKPANEPICLARKPLDKGLTIAENGLKWGVGALNIDGSRIETVDKINSTTNQNIKGAAFKADNSNKNRDTVYHQHNQGRWPANVIFDEEAAQVLDEQSGISKSVANVRNNKPSENFAMSGANLGHISKGHTDSGGASRFFYCAKASKSERNAGLEGMPVKQVYTEASMTPNRDRRKQAFKENHHPTVKPIKLMEYLIKLITPPNGVVLDPFMGSGSTGVACKKLGFDFVGIELNNEYFEIAKKRVGV